MFSDSHRVRCRRVAPFGLLLCFVLASPVVTWADQVTLNWTPIDTLESISTPEGQVDFTYDPAGHRLSKTWQGETTIYIRDADGRVVAEYDGDGRLLTEFVYMGGRRIARISAGNTRHYYHGNTLGTPMVITDQNGHTVWSGEHDPYGVEVSNSDPDRDDAFKFLGNERDDETGLDYFGARYYDAEIGRFISVDPVAGDISRPKTWARYAYAQNNPLAFHDADGLQPKEILSKVEGLAPDRIPDSHLGGLEVIEIETFEGDQLPDVIVNEPFKERGRRSGNASLGIDGKPINAHHLNPEKGNNSAVVLWSDTAHTERHGEFHTNAGGRNATPSAVDRKTFNTIRRRIYAALRKHGFDLGDFRGKLFRFKNIGGAANVLGYVGPALGVMKWHTAQENPHESGTEIFGVIFEEFVLRDVREAAEAYTREHGGINENPYHPVP